MAVLTGLLWLALMVPLQVALAVRFAADVGRGWTIAEVLAGMEIVFAASWVAYLFASHRAQPGTASTDADTIRKDEAR
jgi:hypothetical protein